MNRRKIYLIFMFTFLLLLLGATVSYGSYTASSSTVESGGKITVNVTSSEELEAYNLDLTSYDGLTFDSCSKNESGAIININGSSIGYMNMSGSTKNLGTYTFTAPKVTEDKKYTIKFSVDKSVTVTSTITVKAPVVENPTTDTNSGSNTQTPSTKSTEAKLKTLGIQPNDFSGFSKDRNKEDWSVEVPNSVSEVEVYATAMSDKAKVEGTGKITLKEGNNTAKIKVTAEAGNTKTYTLTIKRKTADEEKTENSEARLKNLGIKPEEYDFTGFKSDTMEYSVEVPNEVEEIEVYATAMNSKAQITGTGMIKLKEGKNELNVEVIAEDGTKKTYTLNVTRKEAETVTGTTEEKLGLSELLIEGIDINPSFKSNIYEYTATATAVMVGDSLNITAKANNEDATIEIIGNENFQDGENVITILVNNENTKENATYQIIVDKQVELEIVEKTSWLKPSTWGKEEIIKVVIILVLIILIICAIILKVNISKENKKRKLPGAEELDKAMTEHQELSEETSDVENSDSEEILKIETEQNYIESIVKDRISGYEEDVIEEKAKRKGRHF